MMNQLDDLIATTFQHVREELSRQIQAETPLLWALKRFGPLDRKTRIRLRWQLRRERLRHMFCCDGEHE